MFGQALSDGDLIEWNAASRFVSFEAVLLLKRGNIHFLHYFNVRTPQRPRQAPAHLRDYILDAN